MLNVLVLFLNSCFRETVVSTVIYKLEGKCKQVLFVDRFSL